MHICIITLFPELFQALNYGIPSKAQKKHKLSLELINPREFTQDKHQRVDDTPYGGGPGMILKTIPIQGALEKAFQKVPSDTPVSYLSPQGKTLTQAHVRKLSTRSHWIIMAGRYEGIDERICQSYVTEEWSLGDFILSGGELAILCMIDAVCRLLPGVLGNQNSLKQESFNGLYPLLEHPHYTKPRVFNGISVPEVLLNGNHKAIAQWRHQQSLGVTYLKRPDLLESYPLSVFEKQLLEKFLNQDP